MKESHVFYVMNTSFYIELGIITCRMEVRGYNRRNKIVEQLDVGSGQEVETISMDAWRKNDEIGCVLKMTKSNLMRHCMSNCCYS